MALLLEANHKILLADGSLVPVCSLDSNNTSKGIGWFITGFRQQDIYVNKIMHPVPDTWKLITKDGREITCADGTSFLGSDGNWVTFEHPVYRRNTGRISIPVKAVNHIPVYGQQSKDITWVETVVDSLEACLSKYPHQVKIPEYFCHLNSTTLEMLMYEIRNRFSTGIRKAMHIPNMPFPDQQRLFHLFDRTQKIFCRATKQSQVLVGRINGKKLYKVRPARSVRTYTKDQSPLRNTTIARYYRDTSSHPGNLPEMYKVKSQFGNIVEKSYVCQT